MLLLFTSEPVSDGIPRVTMVHRFSFSLSCIRSGEYGCVHILRKITRSMLRQVIETGEIIKDYPCGEYLLTEEVTEYLMKILDDAIAHGASIEMVNYAA